MIATIGPLVQGERRQWWRSTVLHGLGSITGGATVFGAIAAVGWLALRDLHPEARWMAAGIFIVTLALAEFGQLRLPLPMVYRSVPKTWWINFGPDRGALLYGLVLGMGVTTIIPFGTFYAIAISALLFADPLYGLALGSIYGASRAVPVVVASRSIAARARRETAHDAAVAITTQMLNLRGFTRIANGLAEAGFGATAIAAAVLSSWK